MPTTASSIFREACGLNAPLTFESQGPGESPDRRIAFVREEPFAIVGRGERVDVVLDDPRVSRRHAFFQALGGRVFCIDLGSRTKLYWEGETSPRPRGWLDPARPIEVGPFAIRWTTRGVPGIQESMPEDPLKPERSLSRKSSPMPRGGLELPIRTGPDNTPWWLDGRIVLVGRSNICQLVLSEASVSRIHAALIRTKAGAWVIDLGSREGIRANGIRVRWAWLDDGDELQIGRFVMPFRYQTAPDGMNRRLVPLAAGAILDTPKSKAARDNSPSRKGALAVRPKPHTVNSSPLPAVIPTQPVVLTNDPSFTPEIQVLSHPMAMWQQQMQTMESFHNDMILMVQMFMAMHREHMSSVRDELDRISQLTREMNDLQAQMAQAHDPGTPDHPRPGSPAPSSAAELTAHPGDADRRPVSGEPRVSKASPSTSPPPQPAIPASASETRPPLPGAGSPRHDAHLEFHTQLSRRVAELQRERQGYWQKILSVIMG